MNILLVDVPSRKLKGIYGIPIGLLYVGGAIERCGHSPKIIDLYSTGEGAFGLKNFNYRCLDKIIEEFKPSIIGFGGIATSYGRTKHLSIHIKCKYPNIIQIAGGALSSVYDLLLSKTKVDVVFHGEIEANLPIFLKRIGESRSFNDIDGISYVINEKIIRNPPVKQIENLDVIPFPAYHLINIPEYSSIERLEKGKKHIAIISSRGCTSRCSFCYRQVRGYRRHSVDYVMEHIKFLKEKYNITSFLFSDELFNANRQWVLDFCDKLGKNNLDIVFEIGGARVDKVDNEMLMKLKETGCVAIGYGQESGSDIILKELRKGTTVQQNKEITNLTKNMGFISEVQLVVGSPSETTKTIYETIKFLKDIDSYTYSLNYLIPLPEAPIWKYVEENNLVRDVEEYLDFVAEHGGAAAINLTKQPHIIWHSWNLYIRFELKSHYYKKTNQKKKYLFYRIMIIFLPLIFIVSCLIPNNLKDILYNKLI